MSLEDHKCERPGGLCTGDDDTDRIIPARFMKCVTLTDLGNICFMMSGDSNDNLTDHALNKPEFSKASIMLSGMNWLRK